LFYFLGEKQLLALFAGLLQERRIIFHSADLGRLSSVVHASISLTYPFTWQVRKKKKLIHDNKIY